jgi:hypothetical protein
MNRNSPAYNPNYHSNGPGLPFGGAPAWGTNFFDRGGAMSPWLPGNQRIYLEEAATQAGAPADWINGSPNSGFIQARRSRTRFGKVLNPKTGRMINVGGKTWKSMFGHYPGDPPAYEPRSQYVNQPVQSVNLRTFPDLGAYPNETAPFNSPPGQVTSYFPTEGLGGLAYFLGSSFGGPYAPRPYPGNRKKKRMKKKRRNHKKKKMHFRKKP